MTLPFGFFGIKLCRNKFRPPFVSSPRVYLRSVVVVVRSDKLRNIRLSPSEEVNCSSAT